MNSCQKRDIYKITECIDHSVQSVIQDTQKEVQTKYRVTILHVKQTCGCFLWTGTICFTFLVETKKIEQKYSSESRNIPI